MSNDDAVDRIVKLLESAPEPADKLEVLYGRFLAVRFVLRGLLRTLSKERGSKSVLDTGLINFAAELDDRERFRNAPPERVSGAQQEFLDIVFEYVPGDAPRG